MIDLLKIQKNPLRQNDIDDVVDYINNYWPTLLREVTKSESTLIKLPHAYIVPSPGNDRFAFEEQYYWDSYFTSIGINNEQLVSGMLDNLIFMFDKLGMVPNGNRYYLTSRSQPPILTSFIFHVFDKYGKSDAWLKKRMEVAKKEYRNVWTASDHPHDRNVYKGLSRYYDINYLHDLAEAESGWDMTPRFQRQCLDYLPIDLNCLLYKYEMDFSRAAEILGEYSESKIWKYAARHRKKSVDKLMWDKRKGFFFDYNYIEKKRSSVWSLAAYYALWSGLATNDQANKLRKNIERFNKKGGLTTTTGSFMYAPLFGSTKTQWAYPNGWAPLQFMVIEGLERYGYENDARLLVKKWIKTCTDWFINNGVLIEKYNVVNPTLKPVEGLYPSQTGFGWTNGVYVYFAEKYFPKKQETPD